MKEEVKVMQRIKKLVIIFLLVAVIVPFTAIEIAQAKFDVVSFATWLTGFLFSRPKTEERTEGVYQNILLYPNEEIRKSLGMLKEECIFIDPSEELVQMLSAGNKFMVFGDYDWVTKIQFAFHKSKDTQAKKVKLEIEMTTVELENQQNTGYRVWVGEMEDINTGAVQVFPVPENDFERLVEEKLISNEAVKKYREAVVRMQKNGQPIFFNVSGWIDQTKQGRAKADFSAQFIVMPTEAVARRIRYHDTSMGVAIKYGEDKANDRRRHEEGFPITVLSKESNLSLSSKSLGICITDDLGNAFRGKIEDGQEIWVKPDDVGKIRITQLENEVSLSMLPRTAVDSNGRMSGFVKVQSGSKILVYPVSNFEQFMPQIIRGVVKIYAPVGSVVNMTTHDGGSDGSTVNTVKINHFGGEQGNVWSDVPMSQMKVEAQSGSHDQTGFLSPLCSQIVFDFHYPSYVRSYRNIGSNPAVHGGIKNESELRGYVFGRYQHFAANLSSIGVNPKDVQVFADAVKSGNMTVAIADSHKRVVSVGGQNIETVTFVKGLSEAGPTGHQKWYSIKFANPETIWVPKGQYGWVPGLFAKCGNATMVYIPPPQICKVEVPPLMSICLPEETLEISWNRLISSRASIKQTPHTVTPSAPSPYIPLAETKINVHQEQSQNLVNTNTLTSTTDITNVNDIDVPVNVDVDTTVNDVDQTNIIIDNSNSSNAGSGGNQ